MNRSLAKIVRGSGTGPLKWQEGALSQGFLRKGESICGPAQNTPYSDGYPEDITAVTNPYGA
jgi:hypothetical protein